MKPNFYIKLIVTVLFIFCLYAINSNHADNTSISSNPENKFLNLYIPVPPTFEETLKNAKKEDSKEIDQDWYDQVMENIKKEEYNISYSKELNTYQSANRSNNIRFIYHKDGFTAKTRDDRIPLFDESDMTFKDKDKKYKTIDEWSIDFGLSNVKRQMSNEKNESPSDFSNSEIIVTENKAYIENENMRIDYTNDENGMRQDFIIKIKPEGDGKLRLNLSADTKLKMIVGSDALMFKYKMLGRERKRFKSLL